MGGSPVAEEAQASLRLGAPVDPDPTVREVEVRDDDVGISEVRAVASASAHAAGCLVAVSVSSEKLGHTTTSSSVSGRTARHERGGATRAWGACSLAMPIIVR